MSANNTPTKMKFVISDEDLRHIRETYCNPAKAGDRLIMRLVARLDAGEAFIRAKNCNCSQFCDIHSDLYQKWQKTTGKE